MDGVMVELTNIKTDFEKNCFRDTIWTKVPRKACVIDCSKLVLPGQDEPESFFEILYIVVKFIVIVFVLYVVTLLWCIFMGILGYELYAYLFPG